MPGSVARVHAAEREPDGGSMSQRGGKIARRAAAVAHYRRVPAALHAKIISRPSRDRSRSVIRVKKSARLAPGGTMQKLAARR
jgi:hypothetical protein